MISKSHAKALGLLSPSISKGLIVAEEAREADYDENSAENVHILLHTTIFSETLSTRECFNFAKDLAELLVCLRELA